MEVFVVLVLISVLLVLSLKQIIRNRYGVEPFEKGNEYVPPLQIVSALVLSSSFLMKDVLLPSASLCLVLTYLGLFPFSSSVFPYLWKKCIALAVMAAQLMLMMFHILDWRLLHSGISVSVYEYGAMTVSVLLTVIYLSGLIYRITDIKTVMKSCSVWTMICLCMDIVYLVIVHLVVIAIPIFNPFVPCLILLLALTVLCIRIRESSAFVFFAKHERRIVESMKISQSEFAGESPGTVTLYNNIYERVLAYFEKYRPYLNSELTINDIVEVLFTNKLYISKAISHCTGRNFCQFVNYYRISYAVELFRKEPQLKVVELANRCGFNSQTSFSAAFRLYMGENPGDWCRKERSRLIRK